MQYQPSMSIKHDGFITERRKPFHGYCVGQAIAFHSGGMAVFSALLYL